MKKILLFLFLALGSQAANAQVVNTEGFESGTMPPTGWTAVGSVSYWQTVTSDGTGTGVTVTPHSGSYEGYYNSYNAPSGTDQTLCSPSFSRAAIGSATDSISFWMYRDDGYLSNYDEISVYINTTNSLSGASLVGTVARAIDLAVPNTVSSDGWYYYAFPTPSGFSGSTNYILVEGISAYGNNMFIDDITWTSYPPACGGAPTAGTITGPSSVCASTSFNLSLTGDSVASGLTYQWYSSPSGAGTFAAIPGATDNFYTASGLSAATDYKLKVTCTASGLQDSTPVFTVSQTPFYLCYCSGSSLASDDYPTIDSVAISGTTLDNHTPYSSAIYTQYWPTTPTTTGTLQQGAIYNIFVNSNDYSEYNAEVWIDYDHSGSYDAVGTIPTENILNVSNQAYDVAATTSFIVPGAADTGLTGMRVRVTPYYYTIGSGDACTDIYDGVIQDYIIDITPGIPCTGTPAAGTAASSITTVCSTGSFNLTDIGYSNGLGITYQWYYSPSGSGTYSALFGGSGPSVTGATQSVATDYILVVECDSTLTYDTSNVVTVNMSPFYLCYCSPLTGTTLSTDADYVNISGFSIAGTALNNPTPGSTAYYTQYWPVTATTTGTMSQGGSYTATLQESPIYPYDYFNAAMWIDFNHNGVFDPGEYFGLANDAAPGTTSALTFMIPGSADTGLTGLRVMTVEDYYTLSGTGAACEDYYDGATEDYVINIAAGVPCTGTPVAGTAASSGTTVCSTGSFNLTDTGYSNGLGISYQWYYSPSGAGTYTPLFGGGSTVVTGVTQSVATDYILVVECDSTLTYDTSNVVTVNMSPFYLCYCSPLTGTTLSTNADYVNISGFSIAGTTLNNPTPGSTAYYTQYWPVTATTTGTMSQGGSYTATLQESPIYPYDYFNAAMWIDFNHNGVFDPGEYFGLANDAAPGTTSSLTFMIPGTADTGLTGLRVMTVEDYYTLSGTGAACDDYYDGATEDYVINIAAGVPCTGTPAAGTALSSTTTVCSTGSFNLTDTGYSNGLGITYQWLSSPSGAGTYTPLFGGASTSVTGVTQSVATDYILVVECDSTLTYDTSNVVTVNMSPFYLCYCSPLTGTTITDNADYVNISGFSISGTTLNNPTPGSTAYYTQYWPVTPSTTATMSQASTYTATLQESPIYPYDNYNAAMWIDFNQNGVFDAGEYFALASDAAPGTTSSVTFTIPIGADTGITGLRVMTVEDYYTLSGSGGACGDYYDGAVEDYVINIAAGVPCSGTPVAGAITAPASICESSTLTLVDTGVTSAVGITFQWYSSPSGAGTFTPIAGATSYTYSYTQDSATDYEFVVTCTVSATADTTAIVTVAENPFSACYCNDGNLDSYTGYSQMDSVNIPGTTLNVYNSSSTPYISFPATGDSTATLTAASPYTIDVNATTYYGYEYNAGAWIDYNQDGTFEPSEYIYIGSDITSGVSASASFTVPLSALSGVTGMRVRSTYQYDPMTSADACTDFYDGQTFDFQVTINPAPVCSGLPAAGTASASVGSACDSTTGIILNDPGAATSSGLSFQWQSSADGITFTSIAGATSDPYTLPAALAATTYFRLIVTCDSSALSDTSNTFPIIHTPCYCTTPQWYATITYGESPVDDAMSAFSVSGGYGGTSISDAGIESAASATTGYLDHTGLPALELQQGSSYTATATYSPSNVYMETQIWIDFSDDGTFYTAGVPDTVCQVFGFSTSTYISSANGTINIPATATPGYHRMRVRTAWMEEITYTGSVSDPMEPCAENDSQVYYWSGDVVDYTVYVVPTYCDSVVGIGDSAVTATTATGYWSSVSGSAGYQYVLSTSSVTPTGAGASTFDTTTGFTGLIPGTTYYLYVRNSCGPGDYSVWESVTFTTECDTVAGLTVVSVTGTSATVAWDTVAGSTTYDYVLDSSPASPAGSGTATASDTATFTGLLAGSTYYAHVRNSCPGGGFSPWVTIPVEIPCDSVSGITISGITDTTATASWAAVPGAVNYQYVLDNSSAAPAGSGTVTTATTETFSPLVPGTTYYVHVRDLCAGGGYSNWVTVPFTTGFCDSIAPGTIIITAGDSEVIFSFPPVSGSVGYYYTVSTSPATPAGGFIFTTNVTDTVTGLLPGNSYYIHIESSCGGGFSSWTTTPFTTAVCDTAMVTVYANDTFAYLTWAAVPGVLGYEYIFDSSSATPSGPGIFTTANADTITSGLVAGTTYYIHVRVDCGVDNTSAWVTVPFVLAPCDTTAAAVLALTDSTATIGWIYQASEGYNYALSTSSTVPPTSGIVTVPATDTVANFTSLIPNTTYYFDIQVICGTGSGGSYSNWITTSFTTPSSLSVNNVGNAGFEVKAFPNPAIDVVTIKVTGAMGANRMVELSDVTGKIVSKVYMPANQAEIDMSQVAAGIYLIKYTDDEHTQVIKINKQ